MAVLELDLSAVGFCDCSGLGALVTVRDAAACLGVGFTISAAHPGTAWLLRRTGLDTYLGYAAPPDRATPAGGRGGPKLRT
jgi:anti-anti-sigma factor